MIEHIRGVQKTKQKTKICYITLKKSLSKIYGGAKCQNSMDRVDSKKSEHTITYLHTEKSKTNIA